MDSVLSRCPLRHATRVSECSFHPAPIVTAASGSISSCSIRSATERTSSSPSAEWSDSRRRNRQGHDRQWKVCTKGTSNALAVAKRPSRIEYTSKASGSLARARSPRVEPICPARERTARHTRISFGTPCPLPCPATTPGGHLRRSGAISMRFAQRNRLTCGVTGCQAAEAGSAPCRCVIGVHGYPSGARRLEGQVEDRLYPAGSRIPAGCPRGRGHR